MEQSASKARLVVILCTERSGSTLLSQMLGAHPRMLAPPEMHLLRYACFEDWRAGYPEAIDSAAWLMERLGLSSGTESIEQRFRGAATADVYRHLLALAGAGRLVVDKTPAYARSEDVLRRVESLDPLYLWLIRHPLGVCASHLERRDTRLQEQTRTGPIRPMLARVRNWLRDLRGVGLRKTTHYWCDVNLRIAAHLGALAPERSMRVQYEKIVQDPVAECRRLCRFLGLSEDASMLDPWSNTAAGLRWGIGDEKFLQYRQIDPKAASRWRERSSDADLDPEVRRVMAAVGYVAN